ncbi:proline dehydrogenase family protein [Paenibacillus sp. NPDC057967]|uniref:proline dehydrogenase family protein n=1 Tax=Paenibacillus sp. NPDC057967 TaxID=3346293 RepID=UPI0036DC4038
MEKLLRHLLLAIGKNRGAARLMRRYGMQFFGARRFVAGEKLDDAIAAVRKLNQEGKEVTIDHLGEYARNIGEAKRAVSYCLQALEAMHTAGLQSNLSLKLTSLGLDLDQEQCERHMRAILDSALHLNRFVRIDMEDYAHCQQTVDIYKRLKADYEHVGIVLQAYLYRTTDDLRRLGAGGANIRLVKGAYKESEAVAYAKKTDVDASFETLVQNHLENGGYAAIATHDEALIHRLLEWIRSRNIARDRFEFQMLYGIRADLQDSLAGQGYKVRVYVPFGEDWFGYFMRRLAERPANVWFVLRNWWRK